MSHAERELKLVEVEMNELEPILLALKKKKRREGLDSDEEVELEEYSEKLKDLKAKEKYWQGIIEKGNATLWRATGSITGARKMGFRRGLYQTADDYLGFYEKRAGEKQDPFAYLEDGTLLINVRR